jgi:hypothetical protein
MSANDRCIAAAKPRQNKAAAIPNPPPCLPTNARYRRYSCASTARGVRRIMASRSSPARKWIARSALHEAPTSRECGDKSKGVDGRVGGFESTAATKEWGGRPSPPAPRLRPPRSTTTAAPARPPLRFPHLNRNHRTQPQPASRARATTGAKAGSVPRPGSIRPEVEDTLGWSVKRAWKQFVRPRNHVRMRGTERLAAATPERR